MELILLSRVFVADLDAFTTQWREYLFNTNDPDGPILQNLVINSTAFELTDGALVWINPATNDEYYYDSPNAVTKVAGTPPAPIPDPPDLTDPYGLRYVHEFLDLNGTTCKFEIYQKDYIGASEEVGGGATSVSLSYENEGKIFTSFRGSSASVVLSSRTSRKFYELFESDEREYYGRLVIDSLPVWTGWNIPDIFTEPWGNPPYITNLNFSDGIGGLKNLPFPDVNDNGFTGTVSEKDAIIACLNRIGLRLNVNIACNIREEGMDTLSQPIEQSLVNVEAFVTFNQGERTAINCYDALQKMLKSWNAVIFQEGNEWWIVREPELYSSPLVFKKFDADGVAISTGAKTLTKTFAGEGILLTGAMLETKPAFTNVAVSQEYGELLVENGNFAVNGNFENWTPYILGGFQQGWQLNNWSYNSLSVFPFTTTGSLGRVRRVSESSGIDEVNNYINIYEVVRSFSDPVGSLSSVPFPVKKEIGNRLQVTFKVRCNTKGSDNRLVEAYFNIGVRVGSKWLAVDTDGEYYWESVNTRLRWRVAQVMRWENITLPPMEIPEDGDVEVFIYQIVQVGSVSKVEYVCDFDDVEIKLVDNPALQNERVYYKTANPDVYTATLEELEIELGDVATIMSQNAKIINGEPSGSWTRPGDSTGVPLAKLLCRELANQYQRTIYRLKSGTTNKLAAPLSLLANYEDTVNEPGRLFILTGGEWDIKRCTWRPDFVEINQTETTVEIRVVEEPRSGTDSNTGSNSGGGAEDTGSSSPEPPSVPVDLGDEDDIIPIIRDGKFEDSEIKAYRDAFGLINEYELFHPIKIPVGTDPAHAARISDLHPFLSLSPGNENGLSLDVNTQVLSIGLASSGVTGVLSGTDWNKFDGKIGGSLTAGRIPFATGVNTLGDDSGLTWDNVNKKLFINNGKFKNDFTETSTASSRPVIFDLNYFANPSVAPVSAIDFHGIDLFHYTSGTNINSNSRIYAFESAISHLTNQTLGKAVPMFALVRNSANGTITEGSNIRIFTVNNGSGNITTNKSIEINNPENNGTGVIGSFFGLYIENITNALSSWGVYDLSGRSYFAGNLGVGQTSILAKIHAKANKNLLALESTSSESNIYFGNDVSGTIGESNGTTIGINGLNTVINNRESGEIQFSTNNSLRWSILSNGIMQSNGAGIIQSSSGNFTFRSAQSGNTSVVIDAFGSGKYIFTNDQGNIEILKQASTIDFTRAGINYIRAATALGSIRFITNGNGFVNPVLTLSSNNQVGINTEAPTNTLDVNGTTRIRTINNLGTAATVLLTKSATGVISERTVAEARGDLGATTLGANLFTIPNPSAITFPRFNADNTVSALSASNFRTAIGAQQLISGTLTDGFVATIVGGVPTWAAASGGSVGAGAGLSLDGSGDIQLGNDGAGQININAFEQIEEGVSSKINMFGSYDNPTHECFVSNSSVCDSGLNAQFSAFVLSKAKDDSDSCSANIGSAASNVSDVLSSSIILQLLKNSNQITLSLNTDNRSVFTDTIFNKGLEEAADYSANKTNFSYITPAWLKYQSGYNASVAQYFTHDGSGNFQWVNI